MKLPLYLIKLDLDEVQQLTMKSVENNVHTQHM